MCPDRRRCVSCGVGFLGACVREQMITDLAGALRLQRLPPGRQRRQPLTGSALDVNERSLGEPVPLIQQPRRLAEEPRGERWIAAEAGKRSFLPRHAPPMMRSVRARLPRLAAAAARLPDLLADTAPCLAPAAPCHFSRPKRTLARLVQKHSNTTGPDRPAPHSGCALESRLGVSGT